MFTYILPNRRTFLIIKKNRFKTYKEKKNVSTKMNSLSVILVGNVLYRKNTICVKYETVRKGNSTIDRKTFPRKKTSVNVLLREKTLCEWTLSRMEFGAKDTCVFISNLKNHFSKFYNRRHRGFWFWPHIIGPETSPLSFLLCLSRKCI